jgi:hypothetical protein
MSYHVAILRSSGRIPVAISLIEAQAAAEALGGWTYTDSLPTFVFEAEGRCTSLWYQDGELWTKDPDFWTFGTMLQFANDLGARVRGDEYETYRTLASPI